MTKRVEANGDTIREQHTGMQSGRKRRPHCIFHAGSYFPAWPQPWQRAYWPLPWRRAYVWEYSPTWPWALQSAKWFQALWRAYEPPAQLPEWECPYGSVVRNLGGLEGRAPLDCSVHKSLHAYAMHCAYLFEDTYRANPTRASHSVCTFLLCIPLGNAFGSNQLRY